jgi:hypothetical protein
MKLKKRRIGDKTALFEFLCDHTCVDSPPTSNKITSCVDRSYRRRTMSRPADASDQHHGARVVLPMLCIVLNGSKTPLTLLNTTKFQSANLRQRFLKQSDLLLLFWRHATEPGLTVSPSFFAQLCARSLHARRRQGFRSVETLSLNPATAFLLNPAGWRNGYWCEVAFTEPIGDLFVGCGRSTHQQRRPTAPLIKVQDLRRGFSGFFLLRGPYAH